MVQNHMDLSSTNERSLSIDLETGTNVVTSEEDDKNLFVKVWNGFGNCEESTRFDHRSSDESTRFDHRSSDANAVAENGTPLEKKMVGGEKTKKNSCKKPPRPPRPPSMDAEDQKLIREINELAMLKRARVERMKALKRMKNAKTVSSNGNLVPWVITLIFCVVILWHGVFSRASSSLRFHGSPESSLRTGGGFISVQYHNSSAAHGSSSTSPNTSSPPPRPPMRSSPPCTRLRRTAPSTHPPVSAAAPPATISGDDEGSGRGLGSPSNTAKACSINPTTGLGLCATGDHLRGQ